jgi:hypothetical protein
VIVASADAIETRVLQAGMPGLQYSVHVGSERGADSAAVDAQRCPGRVCRKR